LGYGFKTESTGEDKTNLFVFVTPKVIQNPLEATKIYKEKKSDIELIQKGAINLFNQKFKFNPIKPILIEP